MTFSARKELFKATCTSMNDILTYLLQKVGIEKFRNSRNLHGKVSSGSGKTGYKVKYYGLPSVLKMVEFKRRNAMKVSIMAEEEQKHF